MNGRFKLRGSTQSLSPVSDCGRGTDLSLQRVRSGTDQLLYLPLQGGLGDCTQTYTGTPGTPMHRHVRRNTRTFARADKMILH